jgi:hypothetical protein
LKSVTELRFSATVGEEPEVEVALVWRLGARALRREPHASKRVDRRSATDRRALQGKEGDIVLLLLAALKEAKRE